MPWYGFIHPILAVGTLIFGIITAQRSMSGTEDWDFPLRRQRTRSIVFFLLCIANLVLGFLVAAALRGRGVDVALTFHVPLSIVTTSFALLAMIITFIPSRRPGHLSPLMRYHGWILALPLVAILTMGFTGILFALGR